MERFDYSFFLSDDVFITWMLTRTEELEQYWNEYLERNPHHRIAFDRAVSEFRKIKINDYKLSEQSSESLLARIKASSVSAIRRRKRIRYYSAAVCLGILIAAGFSLFQFGKEVREKNTIIGHQMPPEDIQLKVGDKIMAVGNNAEIHVSDKGMLSIQEEDGEETSEIIIHAAVMHKLTTPKGKRSTIVLPDGSKVWLNSGSEVEFPSEFSDERNIRVSGEVFLDVTHDPSRSFVVKTDEITIRVYGTKFNVCAYDDNPEQSVVLVEGKIEVMHDGVSQLMEPNDMFSLDNGTAVCRTVANTDNYTSWINGILSFENTKVSQVLEKIGRYYNIEFHVSASEVKSKTCSGKLILSDNIEDILQSISLIAGVDFEYRNNVVHMIKHN